MAVLTIFFCTGCGNRFTHANRHCPSHPFSRLKREEPKEGQGKAQSVDNKAVAEWLAKSVNTKSSFAYRVLNDLSCYFYLTHQLPQYRFAAHDCSVSAQVLANPRAARTDHHQDQTAKQGERRGPGAAGSHGVPPVGRGG